MVIKSKEQQPYKQNQSEPKRTPKTHEVAASKMQGKAGTPSRMRTLRGK